jgi:hypothetical protein
MSNSTQDSIRADRPADMVAFIRKHVYKPEHQVAVSSAKAAA